MRGPSEPSLGTPSFMTTCSTDVGPIAHIHHSSGTHIVLWLRIGDRSIDGPISPRTDLQGPNTSKRPAVTENATGKVVALQRYFACTLSLCTRARCGLQFCGWPGTPRPQHLASKSGAGDDTNAIGHDDIPGRALIAATGTMAGAIRLLALAPERSGLAPSANSIFSVSVPHDSLIGRTAPIRTIAICADSLVPISSRLGSKMRSCLPGNSNQWPICG
ncbi:hypothetical protein P171DRAFT_100382 [Karstenula rhodostoma CBS 690.94]|uniref:Uncharacterized protein n=1 Tax=Karstenula rhodostoma CBS 690.94 TaxID=1392251 RepID=A0A9P4PAC3_9PLEO|nr:hypothetical protein P171DRAFT_100382 [Karstenula rhodostoma CBS 690.94]